MKSFVRRITDGLNLMTWGGGTARVGVRVRVGVRAKVSVTVRIRVRVGVELDDHLDVTQILGELDETQQPVELDDAQKAQLTVETGRRVVLSLIIHGYQDEAEREGTYQVDGEAPREVLARDAVRVGDKLPLLEEACAEVDHDVD